MSYIPIGKMVDRAPSLKPFTPANGKKVAGALAGLKAKGRAWMVCHVVRKWLHESGMAISARRVGYSRNPARSPAVHGPFPLPVTVFPSVASMKLVGTATS